MRPDFSTPGSSIPPPPVDPERTRAGEGTRARPRTRARPAWYAHGFNSATSLRLILGIIPRVPRWIVPAIGVVTTAICLACMRQERRAAARNLRRILDAGGFRLWRGVWGQFYAFSRFMVSYCDLPRLTPDGLRDRLAAAPDGEARLREALDRGKGVVVLTAHIGNWEVGARLLAFCGARVNVVMRPDRASAAERWLMLRRAGGDVRVLRVGDSPADMLPLRAALARNEIVAMQGDRVAGERSIPKNLFGAPFPLPAGPFLLAHLCDAPLLPAFVVQEGWWHWRCEIGHPVRFPRTGDRDSDIAAGAAQYAAVLEGIVRRHPDQWFNFYDLWETRAERR